MEKYKENIERPVAVQITSKGIDDLATEMRVICPLDFTGVTRPRVLLDATEGLNAGGATHSMELLENWVPH